MKIECNFTDKKFPYSGGKFTLVKNKEKIYWKRNMWGNEPDPCLPTIETEICTGLPQDLPQVIDFTGIHPQASGMIYTFYTVENTSLIWSAYEQAINLLGEKHE